MCGEFTKDCNDGDTSGRMISPSNAKRESVALCGDRKHVSHSLLLQEEDDYTEAALATAQEAFISQEFTSCGDRDESENFDDSLGGYSVVENEQQGHDQQDALSFQDSHKTLENAGHVVEKDMKTLLLAEGKETSEYRIQDVCHRSAVVPLSDERELAELLDDDSCETGNNLVTPSQRVSTNSSREPSISFDSATYCSSLLRGTLGQSARRRAAEAASWCSQHQAASQFCLKEELLREEAAAGRLQVRQYPNPHGESFKPMRLYALKEVEQLAIKVWGSLEAAEAEKERRMEERWQRKKRSNNLQLFPPRKKKPTEIVHVLSPLWRAAVEQPVHRTTKDKWEEI